MLQFVIIYRGSFTLKMSVARFHADVLLSPELYALLSHYS